MTRLSKRLKSLALFVDKNDSLVDIGCDHALLSIYLTENKLCNKVIASDINTNALNNAITNIKKSNLRIETILSDGLKNIDTSHINALIISGMGTSTIIHILDNKEKLKPIKKLIIQSNNEHESLRRNLNNLGYYLKEENIIYEKDKWYVTCLFIKSNQLNTEEELKYGFLNNPEYNNYLLNKNKTILKSIPFFSSNKIKKYKAYCQLKKAIKNH